MSSFGTVPEKISAIPDDKWNLGVACPSLYIELKSWFQDNKLILFGYKIRVQVSGEIPTSN
jgi:hypothetical protein